MSKIAENERIVVTGMSAITPIGLTLEDSWHNLCNGVSGISKIDVFDTENLKNKIAGLVKGFDSKKLFDRKFIRRTDRMHQFFMTAADACLKDSSFVVDFGKRFNYSVVGTSCLGGYRLFENNCINYYKNFNPNKVSPFLILNLASNVIAGDVAKKYSLMGPQHFLQEACASGTKALGLAYQLIKYNEIDGALVVGSEAGITPTIMAALGNLTALADSKWNDEPEKASRPFDKERSGFVISEGAGAIFVERLSSALNRNARIYAEVSGFGATTDSSHSIAPNPDGIAIVECIERALRDAKVSEKDVDYINAHGTSTKINDLVETQAIKKIFKDYAYKIPISSNKSMIGHLLGASGLVEAIFTIKTIVEGIIPPTINLENQDPECDLDYVPLVARKKEVNVALSNSFGFGGVNGSIVLKKYNEI
ncbi:MAG: beta-ketoacyl-ACP synthase II [Deferribacterota bacterium]|nr:beta-ketoacyl-ACP synthase II [Deferribacterota bacterium]